MRVCFVVVVEWMKQERLNESITAWKEWEGVFIIEVQQNK